MSCNIKTEGIISVALKITQGELVGRLVAAQNHPISSIGQAQINELCKIYRNAGKKGLIIFTIHTNMVRAKTDCSVCPFSE